MDGIIPGGTNAALLREGMAADPQASARLLSRAKTDPEGALRVAAQQFESLVFDLVLKGMRKSLSAPEESLFDSEATHMYRDLLDQEMSKKLASSGQLGLADLLVKQLSQAGGRVKEADATADTGIEVPNDR